MSYEILKQVEDDFSDRMQWNSFLELMKYKDFIRNSWFEVLKAEINNCFAVESIVEKWGFVSRNIWDYRWFIKDFSHESLCLLFNSHSLHLFANRNFYDIKKITSMLQEIKYAPIISVFDRHDEINGEDNEYKIIERGNFIFDENDCNKGYYNIDHIAWYARYKTLEFVKQIKNKIDKFRMDKNITELFIEINTACKLKQ